MSPRQLPHSVCVLSHRGSPKPKEKEKKGGGSGGANGSVLKKGKPNVVMFVGLQGSGKTTTCTKCALQRLSCTPQTVADCPGEFVSHRAPASNTLPWLIRRAHPTTVLSEPKCHACSCCAATASAGSALPTFAYGSIQHLSLIRKMWPGKAAPPALRLQCCPSITCVRMHPCNTLSPHFTSLGVT